MVRKVGRNVNLSDTAVEAVILLNPVTATDIIFPAVEARAPVVEGTNFRCYGLIQNQGNQAVFIRFRPASADNDKIGIRLAPGEMMNPITLEAMYTGVVSAIAEADGPSIYVVAW